MPKHRGRRQIVTPPSPAQPGSSVRIRGPLAADHSVPSGPAPRSGPEKGAFGDRGGDRPRGGRLFVLADSDRRQQEAD